MSIISSGQSVKSTQGSKVVRFQFTYNLKSLILDFVTEKDRKLYEDLVCHIRDVGQEIRDDDLAQLLKEARGCISILDGNLKLFVQVVLILKWTHRSNEVVSEYQGFLLDLCSAHNYYTKLVIDHLIASFRADEYALLLDGDGSNWNDSIPSEGEAKCIQHVHQVIKAVLRVIPMSKDLLMTSLVNNFPYLRKSTHEHETYLYSLLKIISYEPLLRSEILKLIINKLIALDVNTSRSELEKHLEAMELDEEGGVFAMEGSKEVHPLGQTLDVCLKMMYRFLHSQCHDKDGILLWDKTKHLYNELVSVFEAIILPTHAIHHTQFIIFYFLSFKPALGLNFLRMLWRKVTNPSIASIIRQSAVFYISSLLTRATYISINIVKEILLEFTSWLHAYIDCQDGSSVLDPRVHNVFYATCQALFYVIAFRYRELVDTHKGLTLLQSLNLSKMVTCRLNPLRICQPAVVSNFASVARAYQFAYCYTVMEHNARSSLPQVYRDSTGAITTVSQLYLDSFFPFDPYLLQSSNSYIAPIYREYSDSREALVESEKAELPSVPTKDEDVDDFLEMPPISHEPSPLSLFSYSTSPGFLQA